MSLSAFQYSSYHRRRDFANYEMIIRPVAPFRYSPIWLSDIHHYIAEIKPQNALQLSPTVAARPTSSAIARCIGSAYISGISLRFHGDDCRCISFPIEAPPWHHRRQQMADSSLWRVKWPGGGVTTSFVGHFALQAGSVSASSDDGAWRYQLDFIAIARIALWEVSSIVAVFLASSSGI